MKTDRELLELAAKAVGICESLEWFEKENCFVLDIVVWNPLTDDGDALRLAVNLELQVIVDGYMAIARTNHPHKFGAQESLGSDNCSATRRAIVRAAAELGSQS